MTQIILKNGIGSIKMNALLAFLNTWGIEAEVKTMPAKANSKKDLFAETRGMWADYKFDVKQMRKQNHEKRTSSAL